MRENGENGVKIKFKFFLFYCKFQFLFFIVVFVEVPSLTAKQRNSETAKQRNSETAKQRNNSDSDRQKALDALKSSKAKTDKTEAERQKAIQWIKSEAKDPELVKSFTEYMDRAIINDVRFEMAFGRKVLKSGKYTNFSWEKDGFSIRTISKEEANSMGLEDERIMRRTLN
jgi:hypothetical protein